MIAESQLASFNPAQLSDFIARQPERNLTGILATVDDPALQLRIIDCITAESALKRVSRSQLGKKVKRAAEKKLQTLGSSGKKARLQKVAHLNERIQAFLATPKWDEAQELLAEAFEPELLDVSNDERTPLFTNFESMRVRLKRVSEEHERAQEAKQASQKKITPAPAKHSVTPVSKPQEQNPILAQPQQAAQKEQSEKERGERDARGASVDRLLARVKQIEERIENRNIGQMMREAQTEAANLKRWKREFPLKLDEIERLLKDLSRKRTEVVDEAKWAAFARTSIAVNIQTRLEEMITRLETEQDPETALKGSIGLTGLLNEYTNEMKALGSLERDKDKKIWGQFKTLTDRGWAVCDRMRLIVIEGVKAVLSEHTTKPLEFTATALSNPAGTVRFKPSAFEGEVPAHLKQLRSMWLEIGTRNRSESSRELETVFTKLFETYFRQINLKQGQLQRNENAVTENKRELLNEMKIACEGKSTLVSRARVARGIEEKWKKAPMPASNAFELQREFEKYQALLGAEVTAETEKNLTLVNAVQTRAEDILAKILAQEGAGLSSAQKSASALEAELVTIEKQQEPLVAAPPALEAQLQDAKTRTRDVLKELRAAVAKESQERALERDRVLKEAETLALSVDWESARARFEELKTHWKKAAALGQSQDATYAALFDNICAFFQSRYDSRDRARDEAQGVKFQKSRNELIYSLEALTRFRATKACDAAATNSVPLPFSEDEIRANSSGQLLQLGMRYKQILSLDPAAGTVKETRKIMDQWSKLVVADESTLPAAWTYYLDRVRKLLEL